MIILYWVYQSVFQILFAFYFGFTGNFWEAGEWTEGNQHQPRGPEKEFPGADWVKTHPKTYPAVLWWGLVFDY